MCLRPRETLRRIGHFRSYTDHRTQKDDSSKPVTLAAIHVSQVPQSGWPRPLPMEITHSTVSPHRSVDATGRALPMTVANLRNPVEIRCQLVEIRCQFIILAPKDELTPDFPTPDFPQVRHLSRVPPSCRPVL